MDIITINYNNKIYSIPFSSKDTIPLSHILKNNGFLLNSSCGGKGICEKCTVYIHESDTYEKACSYYPKNSITITIPESSLIQNTYLRQDISDMNSYSEEHAGYAQSLPEHPDNMYCFAIDIGSTCITVCLLKEEALIEESTFFNSTISAGADIISRMGKAADGSLHSLTASLRRDITDSAAILLIKHHISPLSVKNITISCNSAMQHILMELDCSGMCAYPFRTCATHFNTISFNNIISHDSAHYDYMKNCSCIVTLIPSVGPFIGGDIVSGLYYIDTFNINDTYILLDLGTNAEMVLGSEGNLTCTSAAAGPAFEASGLSCGIPYINGAIYKASVTRRPFGKQNITYSTVADRNPVGICGSGALTLLSSLIDNGIIDRHGTFTNPEQTELIIASTSVKSIRITQDDIRRLQVAIAAIRTGIALLLQYSGHKISDVLHIYIAGSFGQALDLKKLSNLKILPEEWLDTPHTIHYCGNTSLKGAIKYNTAADTSACFDKIIAECTMLELSNLPEFNTLFIDNMDF